MPKTILGSGYYASSGSGQDAADEKPDDTKATEPEKPDNPDGTTPDPDDHKPNPNPDDTGGGGRVEAIPAEATAEAAIPAAAIPAEAKAARAAETRAARAAETPGGSGGVPAPAG